VLGGANDDEFGGRGRFKRVTVQSANDNGDALAGGSGVVGQPLLDLKQVQWRRGSIKKDADGNKLVLKQHYSKMQQSS